MKKHKKWLIISSLALLAGIAGLEMNHVETVDDSPSREERRDADFTAAGRGKEDRTDEHPERKLGAGASLLRLTNTLCFDEKSGTIDSGFADMLNLTVKEKNAFKKALDRYMQDFSEVELQNSEVMHQDSFDVLQLDPCQEQIRPISDHFLEDLGNLLGKERAARAYGVISDQLREEGSEYLQLWVKSFRGQLALTKQRSSPERMFIDAIDTRLPEGGLISDFYRWKHLEPILESMRKDVDESSDPQTGGR